MLCIVLLSPYMAYVASDNLRAGQLPEPNENGYRGLRLPLNALTIARPAATTQMYTDISHRFHRPQYPALTLEP